MLYAAAGPRLTGTVAAGGPVAGSEFVPMPRRMPSCTEYDARRNERALFTTLLARYPIRIPVCQILGFDVLQRPLHTAPLPQRHLHRYPSGLRLRSLSLSGLLRRDLSLLRLRCRREGLPLRLRLPERPDRLLRARG